MTESITQGSLVEKSPSRDVPPRSECLVDEGDQSSNEPDEGNDTRTIRGFKWFCAYSSLLSTVLLYALDGTIVADIQPSIVETFKETSKLPWIGVAMFLGALTILPIGKAYGFFNVKWLFVSVVVLFEAGSLLCGAAPNMNAFIVGRIIQGIGACGCYSGAVTYISMTTAKRERPLYLSGIIATWSLGCVLGPVVGGAFAQSSATWRWAFYINLVVAAATAPFIFLYLPSINPAPQLTFLEKLAKQDWFGIVIFLGGSACFSMALTFGGTTYRFDSASEIALWTVAGIMLMAFILVTVYHPGVMLMDRLFPLHLTRSWELDILLYAMFVCAGSMVTSLYYIPLIFQFTRGDGSLEAGVRLLPFLGGMIFFSTLNGALMSRLKYYMPWYVLGSSMLVAGSSLMEATINISTSQACLYGYSVLLGGGCGAFFTAGFSIAQIMVHADDLQNTISFMATGQQMGMIVILSLSGSIFQNIATRLIRQSLPSASDADVSQLTTGVHSPVFASLSSEAKVMVVEHVTLAIRNVFLVILSFSALAFVGSLFLRRRNIY